MLESIQHGLLSTNADSLNGGFLNQQHSPISEHEHHSLQNAIAKHFAGRYFWANGAASESKSAVWNGSKELRPLALVECREDRDVQVALQIAQEYDVPVSVLAGGHDPSVRSVREGAMVLDIRSNNQVLFDYDQRVVKIGGGTLTGDVLRDLPPDEVIVTGTFSTVGLAGFTMGGGYGRLNSYFGLALDQLAEATVVLADGRLVRANADFEPDLFWALRGGGGNFGVVTSMSFHVQSVASLLTALIFFPLHYAKSAILQLQEEIDAARDSTSYFSGLMTSQSGEPVFFLAPLWIGDRSQGEALIKRLSNWDGAQVAQQGWSHYRDLFSEAFEQQWPKGSHYRLDVQNVPRMTPAVADILIEGARRFTSPASSIVIHDFHGAASAILSTETAFAMREKHYAMQIIAAWKAGSEDADRHQDWAGNLSKELSLLALPGGYVNLLHPDEILRVRQFYGASAERLLKIKERYDPQNSFRAPGSLIAG
jgi:FAD/FMN-containing dehydrogenase